jgi:hypothetical protein
MDDKGKLLSTSSVKSVSLNLKVPKDHVEEALQKLRGAIPS